ncbi:MAG: vitamin K epoxide reductase family protein [Actinomycetota bacterium]|nr:vitamin K epoxide reductase family protein [Actinomycetota bacterium]
MTDTTPVRVGRVGIGSLVFAIAGLLISVYLTIEHYTTSAVLACPESATINCQKFTTSAWSHVGAVPVAVLGMAYFAAMTALCAPMAWRRTGLDRLRVGAAFVGVLTELYLGWVELFRINAICLWCTAVHLCAIGLLTVVLWTTSTQRT